jgi:hypothetical protein
MKFREVPDTLEEAKKEIARLKEMLSVARVARLEIEEPKLVDGVWKIYPVITCIGCDEKEFAAMAGEVMASCYAETHRAAQQAAQREEEAEKLEREEDE